MRKSDNLPLRRQRHIDSPYPGTSLSIYSTPVRIPLAVFRAHGARSVEPPPTRTLLDGREWAVRAKVRTVSFEENRTSRETLYFPMETASVLLNQICADWLVVMTDSVR